MKTFPLPLGLEVHKHYVSDDEPHDVSAIHIEDFTNYSVLVGSPGHTSCCGAFSIWASSFIANLLYKAIKLSRCSVILYHGPLAKGVSGHEGHMITAISEWNKRAEGAASFSWHPVAERQGVILVKVLDLDKYCEWMEQA